MEKLLELLVSKKINLDLFYAVRIYKRDIHLQGEYSKELLEYCKSLGAQIKYNYSQKWYEGNIYPFYFTLTKP